MYVASRPYLIHEIVLRSYTQRIQQHTSYKFYPLGLLPLCIISELSDTYVLLNHSKYQNNTGILQYVSFNKFNISFHETIAKSANLRIILLDFSNYGMYSHITDLFLPLKEIKRKLILLLWLHFDN